MISLVRGWSFDSRLRLWSMMRSAWDAKFVSNCHWKINWTHPSRTTFLTNLSLLSQFRPKQLSLFILLFLDTVRAAPPFGGPGEGKWEEIEKKSKEEEKSPASGRIWTHDLQITRRVLYRCATFEAHVVVKFLYKPSLIFSQHHLWLVHRLGPEHFRKPVRASSPVRPTTSGCGRVAKRNADRIEVRCCHKEGAVAECPRHSNSEWKIIPGSPPSLSKFKKRFSHILVFLVPRGIPVGPPTALSIFPLINACIVTNNRQNWKSKGIWRNS